MAGLSEAMSGGHGLDVLSVMHVEFVQDVLVRISVVGWTVLLPPLDEGLDCTVVC